MSIKRGPRWLDAVALAICISALWAAAACSGGGESVAPNPEPTDEADARIKISTSNPRYFEWHGELVYLEGATESGPDACGTQNGWMPISSGFDWQPDLERLLANGGNYARVIPYFPGHPVLPWLQVEGGHYDLGQINPEWLERLRAYLEWTEANGVVVQLEVFENFSFKDTTWLSNPFNPEMNVNYGSDSVAVESNREDIAIYRTVPENRENVLSLLKHYVSTLVLESLPYGNVIYSISNESNAKLEWAEYWADYIHRLAASRGFQVLVGEMPHGFEPTTGVEAIADSEEFDFVDVSSFTSEDRFGEDDVTAILAGTDEVLTALAERTRKPMTVGKIYYRSAPTLWAKFINGSASARFHRNCNRGGSDEDNPERYFDFVRHLRTFIDELDLEGVNSLDDSLAGEAPEGVQIDVLAATGEWYAVHIYKADSEATISEITLDLPEGGYTARWFDPVNGTWTPAEIPETEAAPRQLVVPPFESTIALLVEQAEGD